MNRPTNISYDAMQKPARPNYEAMQRTDFKYDTMEDIKRKKLPLNPPVSQTQPIPSQQPVTYQPPVNNPPQVEKEQPQIPSQSCFK